MSTDLPTSAQIVKLTPDEHAIESDLIDYYPAEDPSKVIKLWKAKHSYFKSPWNYVYPPYGPCAFILRGFNPISRKFVIQVLNDQRELDCVPLGYPAIPITEEEAIKLVEHRRTASKDPVKAPPAQQSSTSANGGSSMEKVPDIHTHPTENQQKPKKERAPRENNGLPSIRSLIAEALKERPGDKDYAVQKVIQVYPDRDPKKLKMNVSVYLWDQKKANPGATPNASDSPSQV